MSLAPAITGRDVEDASLHVDDNYIKVTASQYGVGKREIYLHDMTYIHLH
jgi:hypothetical protein